MKRVFSLFLLPVICISAFGVQVNVHYCDGHYSASVFGIEFNKHCKCSHEKMNPLTSCCNTKTVHLKPEKEDFFSLNKASLPKISFVQLLTPVSFYPVLVTEHTGHVLACTNPPPLADDPCCLFCTYRI